MSEWFQMSTLAVQDGLTRELDAQFLNVIYLMPRLLLILNGLLFYDHCAHYSQIDSLLGALRGQGSARALPIASS